MCALIGKILHVGKQNHCTKMFHSQLLHAGKRVRMRPRMGITFLFGRGTVCTTSKMADRPINQHEAGTRGRLGR